MISDSETRSGSGLPDLGDPAIYQAGRQHEAWRAARAAGPVLFSDSPQSGPFWSVVSYDPAVAVLGDYSNFVSSGGMRLGADPIATAAAAGKMLVISDPPRHGMIKRIINNAFTPQMVRRLIPAMRDISAEIIEDALEQEECNFAETAARLPLSMICAMIGVPRADWNFMLDRTKSAFGVGGNADTEAETRARAAHLDLFVYYQELMALRRKDPREDIVSALVHGTIEGRQVTPEEVVLNCNGLVSGGNETTRHASIGGLLALIQHPRQWQLLRRDPAVIPSAVQEILRFTTPAMHVMRTAARDMKLGSADIRAGDRVAVWLGSANRDETKFAEPDVFALTRTPNRHLTFAYGPHHCIGSVLATVELTVLFEELSRRVGQAELTGPVVRMASVLIGGIESLPVSLTRQKRR